MLGGGVIVQRFGDLVRGRRSTVKRIEEGLVTPTLTATPGDLSLVLPRTRSPNLCTITPPPSILDNLAILSPYPLLSLNGSEKCLETRSAKFVYRTEKFEDNVRTFCMNPNGIVVNENTNGIITVNGHSYEGDEKKTENTNFALLVSKHFSEPFKDSNGYGECIARLSNMLGGWIL